MAIVRLDPGEFRKLALRCHSLLRDVPLHDAWAISLRGGGPGRTMRDVRALFPRDALPAPNALVRGLFGLRSVLGRRLGWDDARHDPPAASYQRRLSERDRSESLVAPGTREGLFRVLYVFPTESLSEIRNATVHAFLAVALKEHPNGYTLYWGIFVEPVSRFTPVYMALIEPFRRFFVYPALARYTQKAWSRSYA